MSGIELGALASDQAQILRTARGLIAETFPVSQAQAANIPTSGASSGTLVLGLIAAQAGKKISKVNVLVTLAGTGLTFVKLGLFDSAGVFLAATAESSASFNSGTGFKAISLTGAGYTPPADAAIYAGFLQFGTTGATLLRGISLAGVGIQLAGAARPYAQVTAQTDIAGNVTLADAANAAYWLGVS